MPPEMIVLFLVVAALLVAIVVAIWRYWDAVARVTPEEEAFDKRVATLNERQANRVSDDQLARSIDEDSAWRIMVERGRRSVQRRSRYAGNLARRTRERRSR